MFYFFASNNLQICVQISTIQILVDLLFLQRSIWLFVALNYQHFYFASFSIPCDDASLVVVFGCMATATEC